MADAHGEWQGLRFILAAALTGILTQIPWYGRRFSSVTSLPSDLTLNITFCTKLASLRYPPYFQNRRASSSSPNSHMYTFSLSLLPFFLLSCKVTFLPLFSASQIHRHKNNVVNFTLPEHLQKGIQPLLIRAFLFCLHYPGHHTCSPA